MDKENKKVYVLEELTGEYEDKHTHILACYVDPDKAKADAARYQKRVDTMLDRYEKVSDCMEELKDSIFKEFLKDINKELYDELIAEEELISKNASGQSRFDWDKYYDGRDEFYADTETFKEYAAKYGCTEEQIEGIEIYNEVEDEGMMYSRPYYFVSNYPVDLIE